MLSRVASAPTAKREAGLHPPQQRSEDVSREAASSCTRSRRIHDFAGLRFQVPIAAALATCLVAPAARAELYDAVDLSQVTQEEDLRDLAYQGDLDDEDVSILIELLLDPVDLNRARRDALYQLPSLTYEHVDAILAWRQEHGRFESVDQLLEVPGITPDILAQLARFAAVRPPVSERLRPSGSVKVRGAGIVHSGERPEGYAVAQAGAQDFDAAVVLLEQPGVGAWAFDPNDLSFNIALGSPVYSLAKVYVAVDRPTFSAILGSYTAGFGQRLTFDVSQRTRPNGFYRDHRVSNSIDFDASQRLFGAAATWNGASVGEVSIGGTAFISVGRKDLYQNYFSVLPPAGVEYGELAYGLSPDFSTADGTDYQYVTLPDLYSEAILGVHGEVDLPGIHRLGVTAWGARLNPRAPIYFLNQLPDRPLFGAVGLDFSTGYGSWDAAGEIAVMDSGGVGALVRAARGTKKGEIVISARHYGEGFDNPYSRGKAQADTYSSPRPDRRDVGDPPLDPDEITGYDRDRDEQGVRVEGYWKAKPWLRLTAFSDQWRAPSTGLWDLDTQVRADFEIRKAASIDVLLRYQDKVLSQYGRARSYGDDVGCDPDDPDAQCGGEVIEDLDTAAGSKITAGSYLTLRVIPLTTWYVSYRRYYEDDRRTYIDTDCESPLYYFRIGQVASLKGTADLPLDLRSTLRVRYLDDDVYGNAGARELGAYAQLEWWDPRGRFRVGGRYSVDTGLRDPWDKDVIRCDNGGELPPDRSDWPADERSAPPQQTVLATFEYRF